MAEHTLEDYLLAVTRNMRKAGFQQELSDEELTQLAQKFKQRGQQGQQPPQPRDLLERVPPGMSREQAAGSIFQQAPAQLNRFNPNSLAPGSPGAKRLGRSFPT